MKKEKMDFFEMAVMFVISLAIIMAALFVWANISADIYKEIVNVETVQIESFDASVKGEEEGYLITYLKNDTVEMMFTAVNKTEIKEMNGKRTARITTWQAEDKIVRFLLSGHPLKKTVEFELDSKMISKIN